MTLAEQGRKLGISRQAIWQRNKRKEGKCITCGKIALKPTPVLSKYSRYKNLSYCEKCKGSISSKTKRYFSKNRDYLLKKQTKWKENNREYYLNYQRNYQKMKRASNDNR